MRVRAHLHVFPHGGTVNKFFAIRCPAGMHFKMRVPVELCVCVVERACMCACVWSSNALAILTTQLRVLTTIFHKYFARFQKTLQILNIVHAQSSKTMGATNDK